MRVMSFNLLCWGQENTDRFWTKRIPLVTRIITKYEPDTLGVQEATPGWMKALKGALPEYACVGVGRDNGKNKGEYSAVFYKKAKYKLLDSGTFWLSETPDKPGLGWDARCVRICTYAKLQEKKTGKVFVHFNTHLDHIGPIAMQKGAELVTLKAKELCEGVPAFFTGDFNVTPDSAPCKAVKDGGFIDCRDVAKKTDKDFTFHAFGTAASVIDYVFYKGDIKVDKFAVIREKVDKLYPSDHYSVYADLKF